MIIVIQLITAIWTRESRGGTAANRRNALPEVLSLPIDPKQRITHASYKHTVSFHEWYKFEPSAKVTISDLNGPIDLGTVTVMPRDHGLATIYQGPTGAPKRRMLIPYETFTLDQPDQWGQFIYNGRYSQGHYAGDLTWWEYRKYVLNIGLADSLRDDLFMRGKPLHRHIDLADLW